MCKALARNGFVPVTLDNLSTGHRWAVQWGPLIEGDLLDEATLREAFAHHRITAVMHFAVRPLVAESVADPGLYFRNNVTGYFNAAGADAEGETGEAHEPGHMYSTWALGTATRSAKCWPLARNCMEQSHQQSMHPAARAIRLDSWPTLRKRARFWAGRPGTPWRPRSNMQAPGTSHELTAEG